jgi:hypothetical protein
MGADVLGNLRGTATKDHQRSAFSGEYERIFMKNFGYTPEQQIIAKREERRLSAVEREARTRHLMGDYAETHAAIAVAKALSSLGRDLDDKDRAAIARAEERRTRRRMKRSGK